MRNHEYHSHIIWDGNHGDGTSSYATYGRAYRVVIEGKSDIAGSAHTTFRGEAHKHDPEDLFLAAIASCHLLAYLALCATRGVKVVAYEDRAHGTLKLHGSGGRFEEVVLHPVVTIAESDAALAEALHHDAHESCFIASSCSVPIRCEPEIRVVEVMA